VTKRAVEIVKTLDLTPTNLDLFEDCERISHEVVSYSSPSFSEGEILVICRWVESLHEPIYRTWFPRYLNAARDVFGRLPMKGDVKGALTAYHQLEQLVNEIGDEELKVVGEDSVKQTITAVKHVHDENRVKRTKLRERYGLE